MKEDQNGDDVNNGRTNDVHKSSPPPPPPPPSPPPEEEI